ncbi:MAG: hypothetical protein K8H87_10265 [Pseudorhodoplanes sp.]|nr:hypothetical protein [Pseudorhodoplanes sp.]
MAEFTYRPALVAATYLPANCAIIDKNPFGTLMLSKDAHARRFRFAPVSPAQDRGRADPGASDRRRRRQTGA